MPLNSTVLYVEDNFENRVLIRRILQAEGYIVLEAETGSEAISTVRELKPDIILVDINMPDMDGYTLTSKLKTFRHLKGVPVVALTANVMKGDRERSFQAGCDGYIQKPVDVDSFPVQVASYLKR